MEVRAAQEDYQGLLAQAFITAAAEAALHIHTRDKILVRL
jgi:hypothetical protein